MRLVAHRGFADRNPENTVPAVRAAADVADAVEVDVRRAGSGDLVVVHDETVDRMTAASGRIAAFDASELGDLSVLGSDAGIPRLDAVLDAVPADTAVNLELKERGTAADALAVAADAENQVFVSSFDADALAEARDADADVARAYLFDRGARDGVDTAVDLDCAFAHPKAALCLRSRVVSRAHDAGLDVNAWTVTSRTVASLLDRRGVDGVVADSPVI